MADIGAGIV